VVLPCCRGWKVRWWCYLSGHLLGLLLQLLDDLIAGAAVVAPRRRAVLLPLLQADPAEVVFALQGRGGRDARSRVNSASKATASDEIFRRIPECLKKKK
jgi:hypothetical protein